MLNANLLYLKLVRHEMLNCKLAIVKTPTIYEDPLDDCTERHLHHFNTNSWSVPLTRHLVREKRYRSAFNYHKEIKNIQDCPSILNRKKNK